MRTAAAAVKFNDARDITSGCVAACCEYRSPRRR